MEGFASIHVRVESLFHQAPSIFPSFVDSYADSKPASHLSAYVSSDRVDIYLVMPRKAASKVQHHLHIEVIASDGTVYVYQQLLVSAGHKFETGAKQVHARTNGPFQVLTFPNPSKPLPLPLVALPAPPDIPQLEHVPILVSPLPQESAKVLSSRPLPSFASLCASL